MADENEAYEIQRSEDAKRSLHELLEIAGQEKVKVMDADGSMRTITEVDLEYLRVKLNKVPSKFVMALTDAFKTMHRLIGESHDQIPGPQGELFRNTTLARYKDFFIWTAAASSQTIDSKGNRTKTLQDSLLDQKIEHTQTYKDDARTGFFGQRQRSEE